MRPIFNSLGSNYSAAVVKTAFGQVWPSLVSLDGPATAALEVKLGEQFGGKAFSFFKGRDAIEFALRTLELQPDELVMTQALACYAIEEAIVRAGASPLYVDVAENSVNLSLDTIKATYEACADTSKIRALLVQHTLGVPVALASLKQWCKAHDIVLIEDLAQSFGGQDGAGVSLGSAGEIVICSFGRDKVIDAVSGGACIIKSKTLAKRAAAIYSKQVTSYPRGLVVARDMLYPLVTHCIRNTQAFRPLFFYLGKAFGVLSSPTLSSTATMTKLPNAYALLALDALAKVETQLYHRRQLALWYSQALTHNKEHSHLVEMADVQNGAMLRFPIVVQKPDQLARELASQDIHLTDRWYRSPVDSGSLQLPSSYAVGSCPNAEQLAKQVFNLPTHHEITKDDAQRIVSALQKLLG